MALTKEIIKSDKVLDSLTDEQINAITTLSTNDESIVINTKIGEQHGRLEQDILEVSGIEKQEGEKDHKYLKRVLGSLKEKETSYNELQNQFNAQKSKIETLESKIAEGKGNEQLVQKLQDAEGKLTALQTQYDQDKQVWKDKETENNNKLIDSEFNRQASKLKFKSDYPESVQKILINSAKSNILKNNKPDWIETGSDKDLVFRDEKGEIVRNKSNKFNPYTVEDLLVENLKDVLDFGQKKKGAGTENPGSSKTDEIQITDISIAKSQMEADKLIVKHLMQLGEIRGTSSFADKQKKIREENNVHKLPLR